MKARVIEVGRIDITGYSDSELSLMVFNNEALYRLRHRSNLRDILEYDYLFTEAQWAELENDLNEENESE